MKEAPQQDSILTMTGVARIIEDRTGRPFSASGVRRLCDGGKLPFIRTSNGERIVPRLAVEAEVRRRLEARRK